MQFEDMWSRELLDINHVNNWFFCTMNAAHVIDCRSQFCGLKLQSYINFGVEGYENESALYMKKLHKGTNINLLDTMPLDKLLMYCGLDSILTFRLYEIQKKILFQRNEPRGSAFRMITMPGLQALSDASITGINMDSFYYQEVTWDLEKQLKELDEYLLNGDVATKFKQLTGRNLTIQKDFSADDIRIIIYDIFKTKSKKKTAKGLNSADKEVVESIDNEWTKKLIERRKIYKLLNTYISGFKRAIGIDYKIHPSFPLHIPQSYRGSSFDPNFQNIPNRDETAKAATRKGIKPSEGRRIGCIDYGSQEVNVAAILSQDPKLMWYCTEGNDPHMDVTMRIWEAEKELIPGLLRYHSKSGFVFAEIYGSFYINCAVNMWELCGDLQLNNGINVIDHLVSKGIITNDVDKTAYFKIRGKKRQISKQLYDFIHHVKSVEEWFWGEFSGLRDWQNRMVEIYQKKGCVEMPFRFKRTGYLSNNQIFNTAIQGTAFHLLLWSYIQLNKKAKKEWRTNLIGQIHDEILFDITPNELQIVLNTAENIMINGVRDRFKWANVPLKVEPEVTQVNEAWYYKREMVKNDNGIWDYK
jgi:DNA polymerase-1